MPTNIKLQSVVAKPSRYQSAIHLARKGSMASPMTHQTQPDMKAYFRALSSHSSAMMVYPALTPTGKKLVPRAVRMRNAQ